MNDRENEYAFGPFLLRPAEHQLFRDGHLVSLSPKPFAVLVVLVENHGRLLTKEELIQAVWHDAFVEEGNVCVTVSHLRKALGDENYIETVAKYGYRFVADVQRLPTGTRPAALKEKPASPAEAPQEKTPKPQRQLPRGLLADIERLRSGRPVLLSAAVLAIGIVLASGAWPRVRAAIYSIKPLEVKSLAVLPFETLGGRAGDDYLGLGMADALITKLGSTARIVLRSTRAIQKYQHTAQDPRAVGREQNVDAVLDGRIQRAGERVRVTAQLIRVSDGMQLWADTFDEDFTNLFAVEDTVSARVASSIRLELTGEQKERLAKRPTTNPEAYESYLRGRYFWSERTGKGLEKSLQYFRHAIDLDPAYAKAYAGIADSYAMLGLYTVRAPKEAFSRAKEAALRALEIDNSLAEAHATLGFVHFYYDWDGAAADKEFTTALQLDPNYAMAHSWRGFNLSVLGRFSEAVTEAKLAEAADPLSAATGTNAGWVYFLARQDTQATETLEKVIEIDPNFPRAHFRLGNVYEQQRKYNRAISEYQKAVELSEGDAYYEAALGHAFAISGNFAEAQKILKRLLEMSKNRYVPPYAMALIYVGMGKKQDGLDWLQRAAEDHSTSVAYLRVDPSLNLLRSEPKFAALVEQTKF